MADEQRIQVERIAEFIKPLRVKPGSQVTLSKQFDPAWKAGITKKKDGVELLQAGIGLLADYQSRLAAENRYGVLVCLQALDAGGKDGTIRHVMSGVNPQGVRVSGFKVPTSEELDHDYLWRYARRLPARGEIGIFNRSHYEDVVTVGVMELAPEEVWRPRIAHNREFEQMLTAEGTTVVKCFLNVSKEEQKQRFEARLADPTKRWKFNPRDLETRKRWDRFVDAYEEALTSTSTDAAPWYVIPADRKWVRNIAIATLLVDTLHRLDPQFPEPQFDDLRIDD